MAPIESIRRATEEELETLDPQNNKSIWEDKARKVMSIIADGEIAALDISGGSREVRR
ncbi:hypothetical protein JXA63_04010 [Candidatus Woesebacteria bacterium]|nr:hypothetical protein [Candidatus Woesebacteria bacterium]